MANKVILAGGSGFIGKVLAQHLDQAGWEVVILTRSPRDGTPIREVGWNGETGGAWTAELEGATAIINLAGRSINCVHTLQNCQEIVTSRENATRALGKGWSRVKHPPLVWLQISATGFYGNAGDRICDESLPAGPGFLAAVCQQNEAAFAAQELPGVRRVVLRLGVVLGSDGGALPALTKLTRFYLGGSAGSGRQYLSWIHLDDVVLIIKQALTKETWTGPYNACAPHPVTNAEFMRTLRQVLKRPWCPPAPEFIVRFAARQFLKTDGNLALHGQRCIPARLQADGVKFQHPQLLEALQDLSKPH